MMVCSIHSKKVALILLLMLLTTLADLQYRQTQCHDQIIFEPWDVVGSLLIRYNKEPCSGLFWYPFCQNSGWGDEEATVACRELGYSYGVSGLSVAFQGAQGYSSIECEGIENSLEECAIEAVDFAQYCSLVGVTQCYVVPQVEVYIPESMGYLEVSEDGLAVELCVAIRAQLEETAHVLIETRDNGSALANFDYIPISSTLTFGPLHELEQCLQIEIIDDLLAEELEQLTVVLSTTSLAINITDREFQILIGPNDFEYGACAEGSVTVVSDTHNSSLQLVEMCSEGVWSPVCDNNWTLQDASVVCRELGQGNTPAAAVVLDTHALSGTVFPECSGSETRLANCSTTQNGENSTCSYVLVNCDSETTTRVQRFDLWTIVSSAAVVIMGILIVVIVIGIGSIIYSRWSTTRKEKRGVRCVSSNCHSNRNTLSMPHQPQQIDSHSDISIEGEFTMDNPFHADTVSTSPSSCRLSDTIEHNLINPLYAETEEPSLNPVDESMDDSEANLTESIAEHHYETPYDVTAESEGGAGRDGVKKHLYEYVDGPMTNL